MFWSFTEAVSDTYSSGASSENNYAYQQLKIVDFLAKNSNPTQYNKSLRPSGDNVDNGSGTGAHSQAANSVRHAQGIHGTGHRLRRGKRHTYGLNFQAWTAGVLGRA